MEYHRLRSFWPAENDPLHLVERTTKVGSTRDAGGEIIETESTTTEEYDHQQRLYRVSEPSGSDGAMVTTTSVAAVSALALHPDFVGTMIGWGRASPQ